MSDGHLASVQTGITQVGLPGRVGRPLYRTRIDADDRVKSFGPAGRVCFQRCIGIANGVLRHLAGTSAIARQAELERRDELIGDHSHPGPFESRDIAPPIGRVGAQRIDHDAARSERVVNLLVDQAPNSGILAVVGGIAEQLLAQLIGIDIYSADAVCIGLEERRLATARYTDGDDRNLLNPGLIYARSSL